MLRQMQASIRVAQVVRAVTNNTQRFFGESIKKPNMRISLPKSTYPGQQKSPMPSGPASCLSHANALNLTSSNRSVMTKHSSPASPDSIKYTPSINYDLWEKLKTTTAAQQFKWLPKQTQSKTKKPNEGPPLSLTSLPKRLIHNPLSRRQPVDKVRLRNMNDLYKKRTYEVEMRQPQANKFISRQALHSGRVDKIG